MKRIFWIVLAAALADAGCISLTLPDHSPWARNAQAKDKAAPPAPEATPPAPVFEDQIDETNAQEKAAALREELDFDSAHPPTANVVVTKPEKAK
jgi:hypothetical protein